MLNAALFLAAAAAAVATEPAPEPRGAQIASAQVAVRILRPAIVRQASGPERTGDDAPVPQITRRGAEVLVEYQ